MPFRVFLPLVAEAPPKGERAGCVRTGEVPLKGGGGVPPQRKAPPQASIIPSLVIREVPPQAAEAGRRTRELAHSTGVRNPPPSALIPVLRPTNVTSERRQLES
jgi:hypothetical protein